MVPSFLLSLKEYEYVARQWCAVGRLGTWGNGRPLEAQRMLRIPGSMANQMCDTILSSPVGLFLFKSTIGETTNHIQQWIPICLDIYHSQKKKKVNIRKLTGKGEVHSVIRLRWRLGYICISARHCIKCSMCYHLNSLLPPLGEVLKLFPFLLRWWRPNRV